MNFPHGFILVDNAEFQISVFNPIHKAPSGIKCPHCKTRTTKWGQNSGKQRYYCKHCNVSFNADTMEAPLLAH